jgi:hypothetical protein
MHRPFLFALALLLAATVSVGQTASADSQTLQALLAEVREFRFFFIVHSSRKR